MTRWGLNTFRDELVRHLEAAEEGIAVDSLRYDAPLGRWVADCFPELESPPGLLQGRRLVVDASDRGMTVFPLGLDGRFRVSAGFSMTDGSSTTAPERVSYGAGEVSLHGPGWRVDVRVSPTLPVVELALSGGKATAATLALDDRVAEPLDEASWAVPAIRPEDPLIARNNSTIPDPLPLPAPRAGLLALPRGERLVLAVAAGREEAEAAAALWETRRATEVGYWPGVADRLAFRIPDSELQRQLPYSVHNSLFSRSTDEEGRDIFIHGRRDRGYADTAHLHQSYQMHLPALAAGEAASVRDELLAFCALQDANGWIERAPRPIRGSSLYVGRYTGAHLLLAAARYLAWTGDRAFFAEPAPSTLDPTDRTFRERVRLAADDLVAHQYDGLIAPCGWADAWNPEVRAQGQISATAVLALREWSAVELALGDGDAAAARATEADRIADRMREVLLDTETGIVAEHVFEDAITGGAPDDYWTHTQIWSALADVTSDGRGLDRSARDCLRHGMSIAPETAFDQAYVAESTDSTADLPLESTATWLMASWPEVTHLYALAELDRARPDAALGAVLSQLPERLHALDPVVAPMYYAEKYLFPGTRPWLCTWAGDPSLVEVVLTGFLGVHAEPQGLRISPMLPSTWIGHDGEASFIWRGTRVTLRLSPGLPAGTYRVGEETRRFGDLIERLDEAEATILVSSTQSIA